MKISLIAGHGAGDPGAIGVFNGKTYREADEARSMVSLIAEELRRNNVEVIVRDTNQNAYKDALAGKLVFPNGLKYVLEIHFNAVSQSVSDKKTKGVECYVTTNEASTNVEEEICKAISTFGLTNRGVKRKNFTVIQRAKKAGISSALLELCFIDDPDDMAIYLAKKKQIAIAIAKAICECYGLAYSEGKQQNVVQKSKPSEWAKEACNWAIKEGIVKGDENGDYRWQDPISKEQMALILYRFIKGGV